MKHTHTIIAGLSALLLGACGSHDSDDTAPAIRATELATGTYAISAGDAAAPSTGKYYAAADGSRLVVLNNDQDKAVSIYRRDGNGPWRASPASTSLELLNNNPVTVRTISTSAIVGNYAIRLAGGAVATFSVDGTGHVVPGATACKVSGKLAASPFQPALTLALSTSGCGDLPAESNGYLLADGDYAPAAFRLLTYTDKGVLDLWAYSD